MFADAVSGMVMHKTWRVGGASCDWMYASVFGFLMGMLPSTGGPGERNSAHGTALCGRAGI